MSTNGAVMLAKQSKKVISNKNTSEGRYIRIKAGSLQAA